MYAKTDKDIKRKLGRAHTIEPKTHEIFEKCFNGILIYKENFICA